MTAPTTNKLARITRFIFRLPSAQIAITNCNKMQLQTTHGKNQDMEQPAHFQSEKIRRDVAAVNGMVEARMKALAALNTDTANIVVFLCKELEKIGQADGRQAGKTEKAGAAISSARQQMAQAVKRFGESLK